MDIGKEVYTRDGDAEITLVDRNLRYKDLLSMMHEMVEADRNSLVYEMRFLLNASKKMLNLR